MIRKNKYNMDQFILKSKYILHIPRTGVTRCHLEVLSTQKTEVVLLFGTYCNNNDIFADNLFWGYWLMLL